MNNLNLDVTVRLRDDERGAFRVIDRFNRIADAAKRLSAGDSSSTAVRGLSRAVSGLDKATTDAGASRLSRLSAAVSGLARDAGAIDASAKALTGLSRSVSRLAAVSDRAEKAAAGIGKLKSELSGMPAGVGFVGGANRELREMLDLQRRAIAGMRSLGGGGGRRGMGGRGGAGGAHMPGVALALQPHGSEALHAVYEQATSLQDAIVKMHLNGLSNSEIAAVRAKADEVAKLNASTTPLSNLNAIMEARLALGGDLNEALATAGEMSKLRTITGFALGKDRAKAAEDGVYDMLRTGEIRGVINDPARRASLFKGMTAAMIASNGRITPKQWHSTAIYGRSATQGFSDEFQNNRLPFLMQELQNGGKGGPAGTALQALFRAISLSIGRASNIPEWRKLGLLDESKVVKGAHGSERALPGAIKLDMANPDQAAFKLLDAIKAGGMTNRGGIIQKFAQLIGTGTGQTAIDVLGLQRDRLENFTRTLKMVEDSNTLFAQINETASQSVSNFHASLDTLTGNIGSLVIPAFKSLVDGAAGAVDGLNRVAAIGGRNGNDPVSGQGGGASLLGLAPWAAGGAWLAAKAAGTPIVGRAIAGVGGTLATGTPFGAALEPAITGAFKRLGNMIPGALRTGIMSGLGKGAIIGIGYEVGKSLIDSALAAVLPKPNLTPEKQSAYDAKLKALDGPIWKQPGVIWRDLFGEHETAAPTADVAGARALGGPVTRGLTYLVGERGPELFTPGVAGGITNNSAFRGMAGTRGREDHDALGNTLAQAIRFQTFALINAIRDLKDGKGGRFGLGGSGDGSSPRTAGGGSSGPGGGGLGGDGNSGPGGPGGGSGDAGKSLLSRYGITDRPLESGLDAFNLYGAKKRGEGIRPIDPNAFSSMPGGGLGASPGNVAGGKTPAAIRSRAMRAMSRLVAHSWTPEAAATAIGQAVQESGVRSDGPLGDTARFGTGDDAAHGMFQWRAQRFRNLKAFADKRGKSWKDFDTQVDFFDAESRKSYRGSAWSRVTDLYTGNQYGKRFEGYGDNSFNTRLANAKSLIAGYRNGGAQEAPARDVPGSVGAFGIGGFNMPGAPITPQVPQVIQDRAHREAEHGRAIKASAGRGHTTVHVGGIIVHPSPGHDEKKVADAVHRKFNDAAERQLNDGLYA